MINHTRGGTLTTNLPGLIAPIVPLVLGKEDLLIIRGTSIKYIGKSKGGQHSFQVQQTRFGTSLSSYECYIGKRDRLLQIAGRSFLVSETDQERILLQQER